MRDFFHVLSKATGWLRKMKAAMLLVTVLMLIPSRAWADNDIPFGYIGYAHPYPGSIHVMGWCIQDLHPDSQLVVHVYLREFNRKDHSISIGKTNKYREDPPFPFRSGDHAFDTIISLSSFGISLTQETVDTLFMFVLNCVPGGHNPCLQFDYITGMPDCAPITLKPPYKISFNANDGVTSGDWAMRTKSYHFPITLPTEHPTRPGYAFVCWNTKADGSGTNYYSGTSYTPEGDAVLYAQWASAPYITLRQFDQAGRKVRLEWTANTMPFSNGKWAIYRNNVKIATVPQSQQYYEDSGFTNESNESYQVWYIHSGWDESSKVSGAGSAEVYVNTTRHIPVSQLTYTSEDTCVILTWKSNAFPQAWGHKFNVYIGDQYACSVTPTRDNQTDFRWEHRTTNKHKDRQSKHVGELFWTEEPMDVCSAHSYIIKGAIGDKELDLDSVHRVSITEGTQFASFEASKAAYPGEVRLSWRVENSGSAATTRYYTINRRRAEKENEAWYKVKTISSDEEYVQYTDDQPLSGVYYEYQLTVTDKCSDGREHTNQTTDYGFALTTGTISGRITFGTSGTSVAGVSVKAEQKSNGENEQYAALHFDNTNAKLEWKYTSDYDAQKFNTSPFSVQFWFDPDSIGKCSIVQSKNWTLGTESTGAIRVEVGDSVHVFDAVKVDLMAYNHFTLTRNGNTLTAYKITPDANGLPAMVSQTMPLKNTINMTDSCLYIGGFKGYLDEFRLWTKCLTENEIKANYDHLLVGDESGLETYWPFDEGLNKRSFDFSRQGTVYHAHHCTHPSSVTSTRTHVPSQLSLKAVTDTDGNYIISGIPFTGSGTNYAVIPTLGVHSFNPTQQLCIISSSSLVYNGQNFDDVSSFAVSGRVLYDGTDYPVAGCNLYVDGMICSKDGEIIETNANGEYTISVPIGEHFIQVKKNGHVFADNGRWPKDENNLGLRVDFNNPVTNLTFYDKTVVNLAGHVVGGEVEGKKAVGFGLSNNNIGTATLVLTPENSDKYRMNVKTVQEGTIVNYIANPDTVGIDGVGINSTAWRGAGDKCTHLYIRTDPKTGEFSALVPPLVYTVDSIYVASSGVKVLGNPMSIDMTNPQTENKDTLRKEDKTEEYYSYHTKLAQTYRTEPTFTVRQKDHPDGSFGVDSVVIKDEWGTLNLKNIHYLDSTGKVKYRYDYPLFVTMDEYEFLLEGYELYTNYDNSTQVVEDKVPLANTVVTIENALSSDQAVYGEENKVDSLPGSVHELKSNQLALDTLGKATYTWHGGLPNITWPYTRGINIYFDINKEQYSWSANPLKGILLGGLPTGNNFVTGGPDHLDMILRDPPGSQSFATWESGSITTYRKVEGGTWSDDNAYEQEISIGVVTEQGAGVGAFVISEVKSISELTLGGHAVTKGWNAKTTSRTVTINKAISTSDSPEYDGADGDLFIGSATNIIFGKNRNVGLYRSAPSSDTAVLDLRDVISGGMTFGTEFVYTQHHVEHTLIPNLFMLRNSFLTYAPNPDSVVNNTDMPMYVTSLSPTNANYGLKDHYKMIAPKNNTKDFGDTIAYYNDQITAWTTYLQQNEKEKAEAYNKRSELEKKKKVVNYSFDAGSTITQTNTVDTVHGKHLEYEVYVHAIIGGAHGFKFNGAGSVWKIKNEIGGGNQMERDSLYEDTRTLSYTLKDTDPDDAISVDVYSDQGMYKSPIFRTRGGQTSNPYEGEVKTKYYQPGTVIMEATMQVEKPDLMVCGAKACMMTDVTSGTAANYTLRLANQSDVNADCNFKLLVVESTNPYGAQLLIDGKPVADGRIINVPYGGEGVTKSLQLKQSDMSILNYDRIALVLASVGQSDPTSNMPVIADTVYVSAQFVPSASPVALALNMSTMNTQTGTDLIVTMKDFDRNYYQQKAFRLQYKPQGGDWTTFHEYVLHAEDMTSQTELLPADGAAINYTLPMKDYSAGLYRFRIVSVSTFGTDEIYVYSNELELTKNLNRPRPLGLTEPADGILDIGDELSITFNEEFVSGELTSLKNFLITGVLNGTPIEHHTALRLYENALAAQTEATVNLSKRDFSIDMWVNIHSNGLLLSHGTAKDLQVSTDAQGHLMIQIEGSTLVSASVLPHDKWIFLTLSYHREATQGLLSASVAYDDVTEPLFLDRPVSLYMDRGPIFVGGGVAGAIHELLLWDEAHDIESALAQRSLTKNPATQHLIGYWKMNEGEGKTIRDYSRNRHMNTTDANWFLNNVNKALTLDGTHHFAAFTGNVPPLLTDDYAAELWFKAGEQNGEAQLFQLGEVGLYLDTLGKLHLESGTESYIVNRSIVNSTWHHVLFNVHRFGTAAVYVDGERALTVSADKIGELASDSLRIGLKRTYVPATATMQPYYRYERPFQGTIDEIRLWQATLQSDMLASNRKQRLTGDEPGLSLYYPFEKKSLDEYNQVIVSGTMEEMTGHGTEATISGQSSMASQSSINRSIVNRQIVNFIDDAPALKEKPTETNVSFSFTASNTKIVIDIDEEPARIEGCMLNITVRDVRSNTGNYSLPATWTAFVHRNELAWTDNELSAKQENGEQTTLSTVLINRSGTPQRWTLSELPAWLSVNASSGVLNPLQQQSLSFRVSASAPIGKHELTVYAMGNNGIETPLTLHITITGDLPDWTVNPADYENAMSVIAQLDFFGEISEDEDDIVAAFIDDECRGIAQPEYKERYDAYYLTMTIYGDSATANKPVSFRAYKASTGVLYTQVAPQDTVFFKSLSLIGSYKEPVMLSVQDRIEQRLALRQGWNWISLSVKADDMRPQAILQDIADDIVAIKGHKDKEQYIDVGFMTHTDTGWTGYMEPLLNRRSYMIKTKRDCELRIVGQSVDPATHRVRIHLNWGWPGYFGQHRIALADAFADADPQPGDIVRTQRAAAYYDDYEWVGSLQALEPGQGYAYYSVTNEEKWFAYPSSSVAAAPRRNEKMRKYANDQISNDFAYPYNMILIGQVLYDREPVANAELAVFDGDECRSVGYTDADGNLLMLVAGEDETTLSYKLILNDQVFETVETLHYVTDAIVGTPDSPHLIRFGEGQGIGDIQGDDVPCTKVLRNGILFIERNGKYYNATGAEVK